VLHGVSQDGFIVHNEQRTSARKILKTKAKLVIDGMPPMAARTADISAAGMSITVAEPCKAGMMCLVSFDLLHEGKATAINVRSKVAYCILSGDQFKVGLAFQNLDMGAMTMLAKFLR
jgi:c-di-GMP-binding flagellar brake protein YcgR